MNLSDFGFLRVLELAYYCLDTTHPPLVRTGVYRLLPPSLQELRIIFTAKEDIMDFGADGSIDEWNESLRELNEEFNDTDRKSTIEADLQETTESLGRSYRKYDRLKELADRNAEFLPGYASKYDWLKELADYKSEFLPGLDRVILKVIGFELSDHPILIVDRPAKWALPQTVVDAFEAAGIDVNVQFQVLP